MKEWIDKMNNRSVGTVYEKMAAEYLQKLGYEILDKNYRTRYGEIDLIAREDAYLVFVEVKYRSSKKQGLPAEAVDIRKQKKISKVAAFYCMERNCFDTIPVRFDVITFTGEDITLTRNAFEYC